MSSSVRAGLDHLTSLEFPEVEHAYSERDTILYALGVGFGIDPLDPEQLAFVYGPALRVAPTMASVLAGPGLWFRRTEVGIDYAAVVHGSERIELDAPLPPAGVVAARTRIIAVIDKGAAKGALVVTEREIRDRRSGQRLATVRQTAFCRGDGGRGGSHAAADAPHMVPDRLPDAVCTLPTQPQAALIYRLSGDLNPLHADPRAAASAGFPRPILHGLATYGVIGHALVRTLCGYDSTRLRGIDCRFTAPVFPGDAIRTEIWRDGAVLSFRALVDGRVVADNGWARMFEPVGTDCG
jgi:acyl dehydratase